MSSYRKKGYINAIIAAVSYGTNPLFALPMYSFGFGVNSVLFYRYFFAVLIYGIFLHSFKKISLKITLKEACILFALGIIFSLSSVFLFESFKYISSGLACTVLFIYPLFVALISRILFKEHLQKSVWFALLMAILGITLLYNGKQGETMNLRGIVSVLISAMSYAIYMVGVRRSKTIRHIHSGKITFYVMLFGLSVYIWNLKFCTLLQPFNNWLVFACALLLAIFPTIISIETINYAIKIIGATKTAIIGALEPLTALFFGVLLFKEPLTIRIILGILLILTGVFVVILNNKHKYKIKGNDEILK